MKKPKLKVRYNSKNSFISSGLDIHEALYVQLTRRGRRAKTRKMARTVTRAIPSLRVISSRALGPVLSLAVGRSRNKGNTFLLSLAERS